MVYPESLLSPVYHTWSPRLTPNALNVVHSSATAVDHETGGKDFR